MLWGCPKELFFVKQSVVSPNERTLIWLACQSSPYMVTLPTPDQQVLLRLVLTFFFLLQAIDVTVLQSLLACLRLCELCAEVSRCKAQSVLRIISIFANNCLLTMLLLLFF